MTISTAAQAISDTSGMPYLQGEIIRFSPQPDVSVVKNTTDENPLGWEHNPNWTAGLQRELQRLVELRAGWDPGGASPPNKTALGHAVCFADLLVRLGIRPDAVSPSVEGGAGFSFRSGTKYAAIEFLNDGSIGLVLSERNAEPIILFPDENELRAAIVTLRNFLV